MDMTLHLMQRGVNLSAQKSVYFDGDSATFLLWNLSGILVGYQVYSPLLPKTKSNHPRGQKYYTYLSNHLGVYGLENLNKNLKKLYDVEGIFDAIALHNLGLNSVAILGNNVKKLRGWLSSIPYETIAGCDGDLAGKKLAKHCDNFAQLPEGKDAGDMGGDELKLALGL